MPSLTFREYQQDAQSAVRAAWAAPSAEGRHPMLVMATGTGKTETALGLVVEAIDAGQTVLWLAHREELVRQPIERLTRYRPDLARWCGIEQGSHRGSASARFVCASIPTLTASPERGPKPEAVDLLVVDEAHHSLAGTHRKAIDRYQNARRLGLTATPERADGGDLSEIWEIAYSYGIVDAIDAGFLVPPFASVCRLPGLDLGAIGGRRDYDDAELGAQLLAAHVVEHTVVAMGRAHKAERLPDRSEHRDLVAEGRPTIVYTATVEQADLTARALCAAGWRARMVCGTTPPDERKALLRDFGRTVDVLVNPVVLTEGTDLPAASCLVLARPTRSWGLFVQMVGRGLRLAADKADCLVIDVGGATDAHSLVSAPILVGATQCPKSSDGLHVFVPSPVVEGAGVCSKCGRKVACLASAMDGGNGSHAWKADAPICRMCGTVQCPEAPSKYHDWIPMMRGDPPRVVHECGYCPATWTDQVSGLQAGAGPVRREAVQPQRVRFVFGRELVPEAWARSLGPMGTLVYVGDRVTDRWVPWFYPGAAARRVKRTRLANDPVSGLRCRQILDDMARRAEESPDLDAGQLDHIARTLHADGLAFQAGGGGTTHHELSKRVVPPTERQIATLRAMIASRGLDPNRATFADLGVHGKHGLALDFGLRSTACAFVAEKLIREAAPVPTSVAKPGASNV